MDILPHALIFQELTNNAWQAQEYYLMNGWILRLSNGHFNRTNSVFPIRYFRSDIDKDIIQVEHIYQKKNLNVAFQIPMHSKPINLDEKLDSLDYEAKSHIMVMTRNIKHVSPINLTQQDKYSVKSSDFNNQWFDKFNTFSNETPTQKAHIREVINRLIIPERFFFHIKNDNSIVGVALGVKEREYLGIYLVAVDSKLRRKGIGVSLMSYIINWAMINRIKTLYLQVYKENKSALHFYEKLDFHSIFNYHYREKKE